MDNMKGKIVGMWFLNKVPSTEKVQFLTTWLASGALIHKYFYYLNLICKILPILDLKSTHFGAWGSLFSWRTNTRRWCRSYIAGSILALSKKRNIFKYQLQYNFYTCSTTIPKDNQTSFDDIIAIS